MRIFLGFQTLAVQRKPHNGNEGIDPFYRESRDFRLEFKDQTLFEMNDL
jgi:hypothetical protein